MWALTRQKPSSGCPTKWDSNQSPQLQKLARKSEFLFCCKVRHERITKVISCLHGCAGWSAPLLFATLKNGFLTSRPMSLPTYLLGFISHSCMYTCIKNKPKCCTVIVYNKGKLWYDWVVCFKSCTQNMTKSLA